MAQEIGPGTGALEVTAIPAGGTYFTSKGSSPDFGNYTYGGALTYTINRIVGVEGEASGTAGIAQDLTFGTATSNQKTPNTFNVSKWYAPNGRWGLRGDYRFTAVRSRDDAPAFFGQNTRYGHRIYVGVLIRARR
jgi:hypothetical protein